MACDGCNRRSDKHLSENTEVQRDRLDTQSLRASSTLASDLYLTIGELSVQVQYCIQALG